MKYIKNLNVLYALSNMLFLGTLFLIDIYIVRSFTLDKVGVWKQILLLVQFTSVLLSFGVTEGFRYYISKYPNEISEYLGISTGFILFVSLLLLICLTYSRNGSYISSILGLSINSKTGILITCLYILLSINQFYQQICLLNGNIMTILVVMIAFSILFPVILFLIFRYTVFQFETKLFLSLISVFFTQLVIYIKYTRIIPKIKIEKSWSIICRIIKFGFPLFIATYIGVLILHIDKLIIINMGGIKAFTIYSVGAVEIPLIALITKSFANVTYPRIVRLVNSNEIIQAKELWIKDLLKVAYISYPIIIFLMLFSKTIIVSLFGVEYIESVPIFKAYCLILLWRNGVYGTIISVNEKTLLIVKYSIVALILNILMSLLLFKYIGVIGVIYATFIAISVLHLLFMKYEKVSTEFLQYFIKDKKIIMLLFIVLVVQIIKEY